MIFVNPKASDSLILLSKFGIDLNSPDKPTSPTNTVLFGIVKSFALEATAIMTARSVDGSLI